MKSKHIIPLMSAICLLLAHYFSLPSNDKSSIEVILILFFTFIARLILYKQTIQNKNYTQACLWLYVEFSFFGLAIIQKTLSSNIITQSTLNLGAFSLVLFALISLLLKPIKTRQIPSQYPKVAPAVLRVVSSCLFCAALLLSFVSFNLGITQMGVSHPVYPFKIEPLLNLTRAVVIPLFTVFLIDLSLFHRQKKESFFLILGFFVWLAIEVFIRGSRGFLILSLIPVFIVCLNYLNRKNILIATIAIFTLAPLAYLGGNAIRSYNVQAKASFSTSIQDTLKSIYERNFYEAVLLDKFDQKYNLGFFANNTAYFIAEGGGVNIHTYNVDGVDKNAPHSSGITPLSEGYLLSGKVGVIICMGILILIAWINDLKIIRIFNFTNGVFALSIYHFYQLIMWGDGLISYYFFRSPLTTLIFPCCLLFLYFLSKQIIKKG